MGHKVFVSYKFTDNDVAFLKTTSCPPTWPCDYVDYIQNYVLPAGYIYKGEKSGEDISDWTEDQIWEHLKGKIYDSSITIVLISPNMKEPGRWQRSQWIPWEIAYSLRDTTRKDRTSHNNAILAVVLPDSQGSYGYYNKNSLFPILRENIDNGYIHVVTWGDFVARPEECMLHASLMRRYVAKNKIVKTL